MSTKETDPRYYSITFDIEDHQSDLESSVNQHELIPICDEQAGIFGYVLPDYADIVISALNGDD